MIRRSFSSEPARTRDDGSSALSNFIRSVATTLVAVAPALAVGGCGANDAPGGGGQHELGGAPDVPADTSGGTVPPLCTLAGPEKVDFGRAVVGSDPAACRSIVVTNESDAPISAGRIDVVGDPSEEFQLHDGDACEPPDARGAVTGHTLELAQDVAPGAALTVIVVYTPIDEGPDAEAELVAGAESCDGEVRVGLESSCPGALGITVSPDPVDLGALPPDTGATTLVSIEGAGDPDDGATVAVDAEITGEPDRFEVGPCVNEAVGEWPVGSTTGMLVAAGQAIECEVRFLGGALGPGGAPAVFEATLAVDAVTSCPGLDVAAIDVPLDAIVAVCQEEGAVHCVDGSRLRCVAGVLEPLPPCEDDNDCTEDLCDPTAPDGCRFDPATSGTPCDDGLYCTVAQACEEGAVCGGGEVRDCSGAVANPQCEAPACAEAVEACAAIPTNEGGACNDGDPLTQSDTCVQGQCVGQTCSCAGASACCDGCEPVNEGGACDDGMICAVGETCQGGVCAGGGALDCSALDDSCSVGVCDEAIGGCQSAAANEGEPCDDGDPSGGPAICVAGICVASACDCSGVSECCDGCQPTNEGGPCDDALFCTVGDGCAAGLCVGGSPQDCSAEDAQCVVGICDEAADLCVAEPTDEGAECDDGAFCTTGETCEDGVCGDGQATDCSTLDGQCTLGACDEDADECIAEAANDSEPCDDGDPGTGQTTCSDGNCLGVGCVCGGVSTCCDGCFPINDGAPCDDSNSCTVGEECAAGTCDWGAPIDCSALDDQCGLGVCDESSGACTAQPAHEGEVCDDGAFCTTGESCGAGACQGGAPTDCSALDDQCALGACNEDTNACEAQPTNESQACDDGAFCTTGEICQSGACAGGGPTDCSGEDDDCNVGTCDDNLNSCQPAAANEGDDCDDGDPDTGDTTCVGGQCVGVGCTCAGTDECCDGCLPTNESQACDDGAFCTTGETCQGGTCVPSAPTDCSTLDSQCSQGTCNENTDACEAQPANESQACDDGAFCTTGEICQAGACAGGGPTDCSGLDDPCNLGACNDDTICQSGACAGGGPTDCSTLDDPCNLGACNEATDACEAQPANESQACSDDEDCTHTDLCLGGTCTGTPITCVDAPGICGANLSCDGTATCSESYPGSETDCDDSNPSTPWDHCDGAGGCVGEQYNLVLGLPKLSSHAATAGAFGCGGPSFTAEAMVHFPYAFGSTSVDEVYLTRIGDRALVSVGKDSGYTAYYVQCLVPTGNPNEYAGFFSAAVTFQYNAKWRHLACTVDSSDPANPVIAIYGNGSLLPLWGSVTQTFGTPIPNTLHVGMDGSWDFTNWDDFQLEEVRVSNSVRYSGSYTPPVQQDRFTSDGSTCGLWHFDEAAGATVFAEAGGGPSLAGANGAVTEQPE